MQLFQRAHMVNRSKFRVRPLVKAHLRQGHEQQLERDAQLGTSQLIADAEVDATAER